MSRRKNKRRKARRPSSLEFAAKEAAKPEEPYVTEVGIVTNDPDFYPAFGDILENPDEGIKQHYARDVRSYRELLRDDRVKSGISDRVLQVTAYGYKFVSASDSARDIEIADWLNQAIGSNFLKSSKKRLKNKLLYGYHVPEIMPKFVAGKWVIDKWLDKNPWRFKFTADRQVRLLTKDALVIGQAVPSWKFPIFTEGETDHCYGDGMGQYLQRYVNARRNIHNFWGYFLDKFSSGSFVAKYKKTGRPKDDEATKQKLLSAIRAIRRETGVVINEGEFIDLLEIKDSRGKSASHQDAAEYFAKCITIIIKGETLTTDIGNVGSRAAESGHNVGRQKKKKDLASTDAEEVQSVVKWLVDVNWWGVKAYPKFTWVNEEDHQNKINEEEIKTKQAERLKIVNEQLMATGHMVAVEEWEKSQGVKIEKNNYSPASFSRFAGTERGYTREQQAIEDHVGQLTGSVDLSGNEQKILEFVQGFEGDLEDLPEALLELYPGMDMSSLQDAVELGTLNGNLHGRRVVQMQKDKNNE